jgi:hypothetical protein
MRNTLLLAILTVLQSNSLCIFGQNLEFYREDIRFSVQKDNAVTDALYYIVNVGDKDVKISLFYPFPDQTMDLVDSLVIFDLKDNSIVPYRKAGAGVFMGISVKAYGQYAFRVYFRQRLEESHFRYILKSTETWGKALEFANYELQMPLSITLDSLSYPPDTSFIKNDIRYFNWKKKDFMPDKDFEVFFH